MEVREYHGRLDASGRTFGLVVARFNELISRQLLAGALDCLQRHGAEAVDVVWVPGAFEIPPAAAKLAASKRYNGIVGLGAVIRGDTSHADHISNGVARGLARVYLTTGVPTVFGIVTAETMEQALERAGAKAGNRGWIAALSAIEMADIESQKVG